jgi:uncharacterized protein (DUF433 family)
MYSCPATPELGAIRVDSEASPMSPPAESLLRGIQRANLSHPLCSRRFRFMKYLDRITYNPGQCGGRPCIRGMRIRVKDVLEMLAEGASEAQILEDFPDLELGDIRACLQYAAAQANHTILHAA